jgi:5'-phosphate synthase pdxT subunit
MKSFLIEEIKLIGVLALQGNFQSHLEILNQLGKTSKEIKFSKELDQIEGLIIPGGESTTIYNLLNREKNFAREIKSFSRSFPILGTCAGLILMSKIEDDKIVKSLNILDVLVERNAYGRQINSFSASIQLKNDSFGERLIQGSFIRAPKIISYGEDTEPFAFFQNEVVGIKSGKHIGITFHPEIFQETFIHEICFS